MSTLAKIRNQSSLLIGVIGFALLLFLLGGDFLTNTSSMFRGGGNDIGEMGGTPITQLEFETRVQDQITKTYGNNPINDQITESIRQRVWSTYLHELVMFKEYDKIGLGVSPEELFYQIKSNNPSPVLTQYFIDPQTRRPLPQYTDPQTGGLNPVAVLGAVKQMINSTENQGNWLQIENAIKLDRFSTKYNNLIKKGLGTTTKEAEQNYVATNKKYTFRYALKKYSDVPDAEFKVSDSELNNYYNEHNNEKFYEQNKPSRDIEYVVFDVSASEQDKNDFMEDITKLKTDFAATDDDTLFVSQNTNAKAFDVAYKQENSFPLSVDSIIYTAEKGQIVGPYQVGDSYNLTKILGKKFAPDSAKASHILVKIENGDTTKAQNLIDSLKTVIKLQNNFAEMATNFSTDVGSAQDGGDLGWFTEGKMVKPFNEACFNGKIGDIVSVTSQFGIHLIKITDQTKPVKKVLSATVTQELYPSKATFDAAFNTASAFSINNSTTKALRANAKGLGGVRKASIKEGDKQLPGVEGSKEVIRWAFKSDKGIVSEPFELGKSFVVATLTEINEGEKLTLDNPSIKSKITDEVIKIKKAEKLVADYQGLTTIAAAATKMGVNIETVSSTSFSAYGLPGVGVENKLIGTISTMAKGDVSAPIAGENGVYIAVIDNVVEPAEAGNYLASQQQLNNKRRGRVDYELFNILQETAHIVDNRGKFY